MGHLDIDDNFFKRAPDDVLVHRYKGSSFILTCSALGGVFPI
jgi:hypothetical protein